MDTLGYFSKRGVEVKVISGDNPVTVSEIARKRELPCGKTGGRSNVENSGGSAEGSKKIDGVRQGDTGAETSSGAGIKRAGKDRGNDRRLANDILALERCRLQHCDGIRQ